MVLTLIMDEKSYFVEDFILFFSISNSTSTEYQFDFDYICLIYPQS